MNAAEILTSKNKFHIKLGLERMEIILKAFNNPENSFECIHIAGTNGKGSTCAIIEKILLEDKRKVIGKYTSPHLFSYTERISVDGENISEVELNQIISLINKKDDELNLGLTEFEILTAAAFIYFKKKNVDIAILETGLGGRLDATNVIKKPLISVITSISFDHKERLGDTIEKIAYEKAGILKNGSKCVFLKSNNGFETLKNEAIKKGAILVKDDLDVSVENNVAKINGENFVFNLNGDFQKENLKLALLAINSLDFKIKKETIKNALKNVSWRFRMEKINYKGKNLLIDSCHNPDGARVLAEYIEKYEKNKKIKFIFGCLKNKEYEKILDTIYSPCYDFCFYEFNYPNALKYENLDKKYKNKIREIKDPIFEIGQNDYKLCVLAGSIYMLGKIFKDKI